MMKALHFGDLHGNKERAADVLKALELMRIKAMTFKPDVIICAGDIWDHSLLNNEDSRFNEIVLGIARLADVAPLFLLYGTPTHDAPGSLEVFEQIQAHHQIVILRPMQKYRVFFDVGHLRIQTGEGESQGQPIGLVFGVPEPTKKFLMDNFDVKSDAEEAVRQGLRAVFTGLGAKRREHVNLPCILAYHGQVSGARLQNGQKLEEGSGLKPSISDLAEVGANYIAMDDIHIPQRVGISIGLHAYYSGSVYLKDFGETHDCGANLVTINSAQSEPAVDRFLFGTPRNQTLRVNIVRNEAGDLVPDIDLSNISPNGDRVKLDISIAKENLSQFDPSTLKRALSGASEIVTEIHPVITDRVREGEITKASALREKMLLWANSVDLVLDEGVLSMADSVEAQARSQGLVNLDGEIEITGLRLKGARGLWANSRLTEIFVDLTAFDDGLVALLGNNGDGKTTILENMHPWPELLTRSGTFKAQFRLKDSFRELQWTNRITGYKYKAKIMVDATLDSASPEFYIFEDSGSGFKVMPGIEGRKDGYLKVITSFFGTKEIFQRSAFMQQKATKDLPSLAEATAGQRKALFMALSGNDIYEKFRAISGEHQKKTKANLQTKKAEYSGRIDMLPDPQILNQELQDAERSLVDRSAEMVSIEVKGKDAAKVRDDLRQRVQNQRETSAKLKELIQSKESLWGRITGLQASVLADEAALENLDSAEIILKNAVDIDQQIKGLENQRRQNAEARSQEEMAIGLMRKQHSDAQNAAYLDHSGLMDTHQRVARGLQGTLDTSHIHRQELAGKLQALRIRIELLEGTIQNPASLTCPTCGEPLTGAGLEKVLADAQAVKANLATLKSEEGQIRDQLTDAIDLLDTAQAALAEHDLSKPVMAPTPPFEEPLRLVPVWNDIERQRLVADRGALSFDWALKVKTEADHANARLGVNRDHLTSLQHQISGLTEQILVIQAGLDDTLAGSLHAAEESHAKLANEYRQATSACEVAKSIITVVKKRIDELEAQQKALAVEAEAIKVMATEEAQWSTLERGCSIDGIQALELDAAGPTIEAITNDLLLEAGSQFRVEFDTQREGKKKLIEDFLIWVWRGDGERQELSTLSGGEEVWVVRALYDAFAVIASKNTHIRFTTVFQDEVDGKLDPAARVKFLRMVEAAHAKAGRTKTMVITHSLELQSMITKKALVKDFAVVRQTEGEADLFAVVAEQNHVSTGELLF